jgi:hypothetical protein
VFVGDLTDVSFFGQLNGIAAYAVGTDACNRGTAPVNWLSDVNQHPVIAQNMFRYRNVGGGQFEQIGESWLKHGFASTNSNVCSACVFPAGGSSQLGVGCSDAYDSSLNGAQIFLGPRSDVNATTGAYPFPQRTPADTTVIGGRLQVHFSDVDPAQNPSGKAEVGSGSRAWPAGGPL